MISNSENPESHGEGKWGNTQSSARETLPSGTQQEKTFSFSCCVHPAASLSVKILPTFFSPLFFYSISGNNRLNYVGPHSFIQHYIICHQLKHWILRLPYNSMYFDKERHLKLNCNLLIIPHINFKGPWWNKMIKSRQRNKPYVRCIKHKEARQKTNIWDI